MRTVYATALEVGDESDVSISLNYVGRWIQDWYRRQRLSIDVFQSLGEGDLTVSPAEGHQLSIRHHATKEAPSEQLVDLRWAYPDQYDKSLGWVIALSLLKQGDGLLLSVELAVTGLQLVIAPTSIKLGSPRVIRDLSRLRSIRLQGHPYSLTPELVGAEHVDLLVSELTDSTRPYPIVLVSRRVQDDVPMTNSNELAERLAGVAKVYELADKWAAFRLTEEVGKTLSCFGGAVRLYWPRFHDEADPFTHPLWMPWQFKDADATDRTLGQLCNMVFDAASFRHVEPLAISRIRSAAEREAREAARKSGAKSEDELLDDLIEMEQKLKAIEATNAELLQENKTLRENAAALVAHATWKDLTPPTSQAPAVVPEPVVPTSVEEAVRQAEARSKNVRFLPSAHSSASASPYKQPERVQEALAALEEVASIWGETIGSGKAGGSLRQLFKARGFDYADDVSQTSKGKWGGEYTATYNGQEMDISPHITLGAKQPDTCLSIHWAWHKDEKVALVAHVGRHKTNTKT
ncbi:hypothetical protein [Paracidovorax anthurii]|uniref:Uncharacterized protein n=1 Tax=Paracidovorax anthurii TaxID=78229 RepID=A0A328YTU3_9BURK|nr:hypothetical protein [Paracidovorax anthurii]RAR76225.1 hypothetical protein AX018_105234 [Paracidovorax anthurii]